MAEAASCRKEREDRPTPECGGNEGGAGWVASSSDCGAMGIFLDDAFEPSCLKEREDRPTPECGGKEGGGGEAGGNRRSGFSV